jgi:hypothetical protein
MGRSRWQPPKARRYSGVSRFLQAGHLLLGCQAVLQEVQDAPGHSTRNGRGDRKADSSPLAIRVAPEDRGRRLPEADRPCSLAESTDVHGR